MEKYAVAALLLAALVVPVAVFLVLRSRFRLKGSIAAAIAVAIGWALNLAWAFVSQAMSPQDASQADGDMLAVAAYFGWICPIVLVALTWLAGRLIARRSP